MQPSEMDAMDALTFLSWVERVAQQIEAENEGIKG